jgi:hypothetical protein
VQKRLAAETRVRGAQAGRNPERIPPNPGTLAERGCGDGFAYIPRYHGSKQQLGWIRRR